MQYVSMRDICVRLLTPNDTLDVAIFDFRQMMYPDIRSKLIKMVNVVINKSIGYIPGLKIEDVLRAQADANKYHPTPSELTLYIRQTFGENITAYIDRYLPPKEDTDKKQEIQQTSKGGLI